jgi:hypothetical protein
MASSQTRSLGVGLHLGSTLHPRPMPLSSSAKLRFQEADSFGRCGHRIPFVFSCGSPSWIDVGPWSTGGAMVFRTTTLVQCVVRLSNLSTIFSSSVHTLERSGSRFFDDAVSRNTL